MYFPPNVEILLSAVDNEKFWVTQWITQLLLGGPQKFWVASH